MPLSLTELQNPITREQVRELLIDLLKQLDFPVEAWQPKGTARANLEATSALGAQFTQILATLARMGFLDTAAEDYLTALAHSHYDELRNGAVDAVLTMSVVNSGTATYVLAAKDLLIKAKNGKLFENVNPETITPTSQMDILVKSQIPGGDGNLIAQKMELVSPLAGVTITFESQINSAGSDEERDPELAERCRTKWGLLRIDKALPGVINLARNATPAVHGVSVDADNPRGPGTLDVYVASPTSTAGSGDVALVQIGLDNAFFGNTPSFALAEAFPAEEAELPLEVVAYVRGVTEEAMETEMDLAWDKFLLTVPLGGFDLTPGPQNIILKSQIECLFKDLKGAVTIDVILPKKDVFFVKAQKIIRSIADFRVVVLAA